LIAIQTALANVFKQRNKSKEYAADSFSVAVCKNIRISRSRIDPKNEKVQMLYVMQVGIGAFGFETNRWWWEKRSF
jgi:hypothetical protein